LARSASCSITFWNLSAGVAFSRHTEATKELSMSMPERDTVYNSDRSTRPVYTRESSATGWFVGIVVALALLAIGYLIFAANTATAPTGVQVNNTPVVEAPATSPMVEAPATGTETTPMAPATDTPAPVETAPVETAPVEAAPAAEAPAPVEAPAQ
jgi:cytoskeletal protein RodZ